jgi:quinol monooxygenase YgiN
MQINLTAVIKALPEKAEEMKAILLKLVEGSTQEAACIQYDLHQTADAPNVFIFHEIWQDAESLEQHNKTPHLLKFIEASTPLLLEAPGIYITNKLN